MAAAELSGDVSKFVDNVEDVIAQADEVDDKYLQVRNLLHALLSILLILASFYNFFKRQSGA